MRLQHPIQKLKARIGNELQHLTRFDSSDRRWQMPLAAALSSGLPLLIGAYFNHLAFGLVSSLGGLVFLYMPPTPMHHRMIATMACAFGMTACYALGLMGHFFAPILILILALIATLVTMICRFYRLGPPGSLFFIMTASIGAYTPVEPLQLPLLVGLLALGSLLACTIGFTYSVLTLRTLPPKPIPVITVANFDFVVVESIVIGVFVGISLAVAQLLQLSKAYWVPVSCLAVIQGASLRAVWTKQVHRIVGTGVGLLLAWALLLLPLGPWGMALAMMALAFITEVLVVRHYGVAVIFITPLTLLLAELATLGQSAPSEMIQARLIDTLLGCLIGFAGGLCLHHAGFRNAVRKPIRYLTPSRFLP